MKQISAQLDVYKKENVCEHASQQCKGCTFSMDSGCALNLVINTLHDNLSIVKEEASFQFKQNLRMNRRLDNREIHEMR